MIPYPPYTLSMISFPQLGNNIGLKYVLLILHTELQ